MPRRGDRDKNEENRRGEPKGRRATGGDYVGRKIIFKFFPEALIDPPSLFLSYFVPSQRLSPRFSTLDVSLLHNCASLFLQCRTFYELQSPDFRAVFPGTA